MVCCLGQSGVLSGAITCLLVMIAHCQKPLSPLFQGRFICGEALYSNQRNKLHLGSKIFKDEVCFPVVTSELYLYILTFHIV